ncbi:MBOAT, membrane-bound O-acyltransferase family-domain-containing protein, partial [Syncephalis pseudoplumigaleata]
LADMLGIAVADLRLSASVILMFGAGFLFNRLPQGWPAIKHLFSIALALLLHAYVLVNWLGLLHMTVAAGVTYVLAGIIRHRSMPQLVMLLAMLHLSYTHISRMDKHSTIAKTDFSAAHMILVIKLTSFAFNILSKHQMQKRIMEMPSLLEYYGYVFFFGSFLVGPAFEVGVNVRTDRADGIYALRCVCAVHRLSALLQHGTVQGRLAGHNAVMAMHDAWAESIFSYLQMASVIARMKYYFVWKIAEGTCILTGLAFNGYDARGQPRWDRVSNIRIKDYELAESPRVALDSWNIGTNRWLRNYVYLRLASPDKRSTLVATLATFAASAVWHGFYAGYYLTFASGALMTSVARLMRRTFRPIVAPNNAEMVAPPLKLVYDVAGWLITQATINYVAVPFQLLTFSASWSVWHSNAYVVHVAMLAMYVWLIYAGGSELTMRSPSNRHSARLFAPPSPPPPSLPPSPP